MKCLVLLAGCGLGDGSCIEETILTYLALDKYGCEYQPTAHSTEKVSVNHITEEYSQSRNVLVESARMGRGIIKEIADINSDEYDFLVIPGGIGLISNYRDEKTVESLVSNFIKSKKPVASMCAGMDFLKKFTDKNLLSEEFMRVSADGVCRDKNYNIFYTPAFRKTADLCLVQRGIEKMIGQVLASLNEK